MQSIEERKEIGRQMVAVAEKILAKDDKVQAIFIPRIQKFDIQGGLARLEYGIRGEKMLSLTEFADLLKHIGTSLAEPM